MPPAICADNLRKTHVSAGRRTLDASLRAREILTFHGGARTRGGWLMTGRQLERGLERLGLTLALLVDGDPAPETAARR